MENNYLLLCPRWSLAMYNAKYELFCMLLPKEKYMPIAWDVPIDTVKTLSATSDCSEYWKTNNKLDTTKATIDSRRWQLLNFLKKTLWYGWFSACLEKIPSRIRINALYSSNGWLCRQIDVGKLISTKLVRPQNQIHRCLKTKSSNIFRTNFYCMHSVDLWFDLSSVLILMKEYCCNCKQTTITIKSTLNWRLQYT